MVAVQALVKKVEKEGPAVEAPVKKEGEGTAGVGLEFLMGRPLPLDRFPFLVGATHVALAPGESTVLASPLWPLRSSGDDLKISTVIRSELVIAAWYS